MYARQNGNVPKVGKRQKSSPAECGGLRRDRGGGGRGVGDWVGSVIWGGPESESDSDEESPYDALRASIHSHLQLQFRWFRPLINYRNYFKEFKHLLSLFLFVLLNI